MDKGTRRQDNLRLYSQRAIGIATFIGGPLAAGYLISENYRSLNQSDNSKRAFLFGLIGTILLFVGIFSLPEAQLERLPSQVIPAIYTAIIYFIVERIHGSILNNHREAGKDFYSTWKAVGIGCVSLAILLLGLLCYAYLSTDTRVYDTYEQEMQIFSMNEEETLSIYDDIGVKSPLSITNSIRAVAIPKWKQNIEIVERTNLIEGLPNELKAQNEILIEYSKLRISAFELLRSAIGEDTDKYRYEIDALHVRIDSILQELNN